MSQAPIADDRLSSRLVTAIADHKGVAPTDLSPPLYESIDLEALDALFASTRDESARSQGRVTVVHDGLEVTINTEGSVDITECEETTHD